jgi:hypothetical protein
LIKTEVKFGERLNSEHQICGRTFSGLYLSDARPRALTTLIKVSNLLRGRLAGFSVERLFGILNRLGHNVEVRISEEEHEPEDTYTAVVA